MPGDPARGRLTGRSLNQIAACLFALVLALLAFALWGQTDHEPAYQKSDQSAATSAQNRDEPETWRRFATRDPAGFFTFCLCVIGGAQALFFVWQLVLIREGLSDTQEAADAAKESAEIARLALEAAETPYLVPIVRAFDKDVDPPPPSPALKPIASLAFENCGRSPATVLEIYYGAFGARTGPDPVPFPPPQINLAQSYILAPGRTSSPVRFTTGSFREWVESDQQMAAWLAGYVRYGDVFGNQFLTGFCFYRNVFYGHWHAQGGPFHNYRRKLTLDELAVAVSRDESRAFRSAVIGLLPG